VVGGGELGIDFVELSGEKFLAGDLGAVFEADEVGFAFAGAAGGADADKIAGGVDLGRFPVPFSLHELSGGAGIVEHALAYELSIVQLGDNTDEMLNFFRFSHGDVRSARWGGLRARKQQHLGEG